MFSVGLAPINMIFGPAMGIYSVFSCGGGISTDFPLEKDLIIK